MSLKFLCKKQGKKEGRKSESKTENLFSKTEIYLTQFHRDRGNRFWK